MADETTTNYTNVKDDEAYWPRCHWCDARCVLIQHIDVHDRSEDCACDRHAIPSHRIGG
jgi:hypothetical protein